MFPYPQTPEDKDFLQKRIKMLKQKLVQIRNRIHQSSRKMRKFPLGQDRYARQYWILPSLGGILIEGVETSLDANLQLLEGAKDGEEGGKLRSKSASGQSSSDSKDVPTKVIFRDDLRSEQPEVVKTSSESPSKMVDVVGVASGTVDVASGTDPEMTGRDGGDVVERMDVESSLSQQKQQPLDVSSDSESGRLVILEHDGERPGDASALAAASKTAASFSSASAAGETSLDESMEVNPTPVADLKSTEPSDAMVMASKVSGSAMQGVENVERASAEFHGSSAQGLEPMQQAEVSHTSLEACKSDASPLQPDAASGLSSTQATAVQSDMARDVSPAPLSANRGGIVSAGLAVRGLECEEPLPRPGDTGSVSDVVSRESVGVVSSGNVGTSGIVSVAVDYPDAIPGPSGAVGGTISDPSMGGSSVRSPALPMEVVAPHPLPGGVVPGPSSSSAVPQAMDTSAALAPDGGGVVVTHKEENPWFSLLPRQACETAHVTYVTNQTPEKALVQSSDPAQLPSPQKQPQQQQQMQQQQTQQVFAAASGATPTQQYVYVTPDGQVVGNAAATPQMVPQVVGGGANMAYALVGNTLVPVANQQPQYVVNPNTSQQPQQQQQGVQYVIAQQDAQGNIQYYAIGSSNVAEEGGVASLGGAWQGMQQPQYLAVADSSGQQQIVQVVSREGGGQMLVQVSPEQAQGGAGGQVVIAAPQQQGGGGQVVVAAPQQQGAGGGQAGQQIVLAGAASGGQVIVGGQGQSGGQVVFAAQGGAGASSQGVIAQQSVGSGQMVLTTPQGNQMVVAQGQGGQMVLVAPQGGANTGQSASSSGQVVLAAPTQPTNQIAAGPSEGGAPPGGPTVVVGDMSDDIIRGGQLVQLTNQEQYGILSKDGSKLVLAESKEAAIAALQAAASAPTSTRAPVQTLSSSPAPQSMLTQQQQQQQAYAAKVKKEPQSPEVSGMVVGGGAASYFSPPNMTPPLSGKATPTTVGQATASAETVDLTRQPANQEVRREGGGGHREDFSERRAVSREGER